MTLEEIVREEPRLRHLLDLAGVLGVFGPLRGSNLEREYVSLKRSAAELVGSDAENPLLRGQDVYTVVVRAIRDLLEGVGEPVR